MPDVQAYLHEMGINPEDFAMFQVVDLPEIKIQMRNPWEGKKKKKPKTVLHIGLNLPKI